MSGRYTVLKRILPVMLTLLLAAFSLSGCGRMTDTSGLTGLWILTEADDGAIMIPDSLVEDNLLTLRLDPGGSGVIEGTSMEGRILWRYEDGIVHLCAGSAILSGTVEGSKLILQSEDETRLHLCGRMKAGHPKHRNRQGKSLFSAVGTAGGRSKTQKGKCPSPGTTAVRCLKRRRTARSS